MLKAMLTINKFILFLILANLFIEAAFGIIAPMFSVFVLKDIAGGTLAVAGFAAAVYWISKAIMQIFVGHALDKIPGERDDFWALAIGHLIMSVAAFSYLLVKTPLHLYMVEFFIAIGGALSVPSWSALFTRHIDKAREGFEWSLNSSVVYGLGTGVASAVGGIIAGMFGFRMVFVIAGVISFIGLLVLLPIRSHLKNGNFYGV